MFRISQRGEGIDDADTIDGARGIVRGRPPGRYEVDEIRPRSLAGAPKWRVAYPWLGCVRTPRPAGL
jgi:hypothetical protein